MYKNNFVRVVIILFSVLATLIISSYAQYKFFNNNILQILKIENEYLAKTYNKIIVSNYSESLKNLTLSDAYKFKSDQTLLKMAEDSFLYFSSFRRTKISLYTRDGGEIMTNNDIKIDYKLQLDYFNLSSFSNFTKNIFILLNKQKNIIKPIELSMDGNEFNFISFHSSILAQDKNFLDIITYTSYIPIYFNMHNQVDKMPDLILEVVQDISEDWQSVNNNMRVYTLLITLIIIIISLYNYYYHYLQYRLINKKDLAYNMLLEEKENAVSKDRQKSEFLANISHELKTPLNAIIGFSEIIKNESYGKIGNNKYLAYVNDIYIAGLHLLGLINDILDYSKANNAKLKVDALPIEIHKIIKAAIHLLTPKAMDAALEINQNFLPVDVIIIGDAKRLKQSIMNILSNAIKFTPSTGKIIITTEKFTNEDGAELVKIIIEDTGIGIAQHNLLCAMDSFGQVESSLNRKYEGTGIGLPFTKSLIELMNGTFLLESSLGVGTKVTFTFYMHDLAEFTPKIIKANE